MFDDYREIDIEEALDIVKSNISEPALYEQLAEECSELSQAALKKARKLRNENPTPKEMDDIDSSVSEEVGDVILCLSVLDLDYDSELFCRKLVRWINRTL